MKDITIWNEFVDKVEFKANLRESDLKGAYLLNVNLRGASLNKAQMYYEELQKLELSDEQVASIHVVGFNKKKDNETNDSNEENFSKDVFLIVRGKWSFMEMALLFFIFEKLYNSLFLLFYFNFSNIDDILKLFKSDRNVIYGIPNKERLFIQAIRQGSVEVTIGNFNLNIWEIYKHFSKYERTLREIDIKTKKLELESKQSDVDRKKNEIDTNTLEKEKELHQLKIQKEKIAIILEIVKCINDNKAKKIEREQDFELKEIEIREKREKLSEKD